MKATRYPSYKPGQSKNIRLLPEHWAEIPLKRLFRLEKREPLDSDEIVTAFRDGTVTLRKNRREDGFTNALKEIGYQRIHRNDLVIHAMDAFAGAIGVSDSDGKSSPVYSACTARKDAIPHFYAYYLRDLALHGFIESLAKGIRERSTDFRWSDASMVAVPVPPKSEQLAIANFLDRETAKIDALIAEQQRLIELLQEKRQAVISHAVTKGLNPNAPMKDSGVEWLGEVPKHWDTGKIKHFFRTTSGSTPNSDKPDLYYTTEEDEQGTPWIRTTDIDNDKVKSAVVFITPKALEDTACKVLPVNTVLVALYGGGGTVGKNGILKIEAAVNQALCGILPSPKALPEYLHKYIQFLRPFWMERAVSARKAGNISQELVGDTTFPIPPRQEQTEILRAIEEKLEELDELAKQAANSLALLEERRSALISAAVTGEIDVRGLVPEASEQ